MFSFYIAQPTPAAQAKMLVAHTDLPDPIKTYVCMGIDAHAADQNDLNALVTVAVDGQLGAVTEATITVEGAKDTGGSGPTKDDELE